MRKGSLSKMLGLWGQDIFRCRWKHIQAYYGLIYHYPIVGNGHFLGTSVLKTSRPPAPVYLKKAAFRFLDSTGSHQFPLEHLWLPARGCELTWGRPGGSGTRVLLGCWLLIAGLGRHPAVDVSRGLFMTIWLTRFHIPNGGWLFSAIE